MSNENVRVYFGEGRGKTAAALGAALLGAQNGKSVMMIQFMKKKQEDADEIMKRLEPEIKMFRFEKTEDAYENLSETEKKEENIFIQNGIHFARKVLTTGGCDLLILDEILGLVDEGIISEEELGEIADLANPDTQLILTGRVLSDSVVKHAGSVFRIEPA